MQIAGDISTESYYPEYMEGDADEDAIKAEYAAFRQGFNDPVHTQEAKTASMGFLGFIIAGSALLIWFGKK